MLFPWMKHNNLNWHQTIAQFMMKRRALWLLLAIMTGFVLITHQTVPMLDRDEARFSQASRQMAETGDVITIRFLDELRAKKPAGIYWLQASSAALFGIDDVASYRLPSLIGFLATLTLTYFSPKACFPPLRPLHGVLAGLC
jgi:4-amino-4-deoxy-L-arabinose transferase and related glycosyltransferases of PMT family